MRATSPTIGPLLQAHAVEAARESCPSSRSKKVSPHTIRHTTAMHLLQSGVDITVIALWLGHESTETTRQYIEAGRSTKERPIRPSARSERRVVFE